MGVYALYKGEELLAIGTVFEIAVKMKVQVDTILYYKTNSYKKKLEKRNAKNCRILIKVED